MNGSLLSNVPKYEISFSKVFFNIIQQTVLPSLYPVALNQTLVALCHSEDVNGKLVDNKMNILSSSPVCESYGLGFIESIDLERKVLFILSNIDPEKVQKVLLTCIYILIDKCYYKRIYKFKK